MFFGVGGCILALWEYFFGEFFNNVNSKKIAKKFGKFLQTFKTTKLKKTETKKTKL
jgi:hypothetical protein